MLLSNNFLTLQRKPSIKKTDHVDDDTVVYEVKFNDDEFTKLLKVMTTLNPETYFWGDVNHRGSEPSLTVAVVCTMIM